MNMYKGKKVIVCLAVIAFSVIFFIYYMYKSGENKNNVITMTILDKNTISIDKDRITDDIYGSYLDNRWELSEIDSILNSIKGTWRVNEYVGFVESSIYYPDLFDHNDNLGDDIKEQLHKEYKEKVDSAKRNIPEIYFYIKEYDGKSTNNNYIYVNGNYLSPISIIMSVDLLNDNYPVFVDRTTVSTDFSVEYPVIYIKFFLEQNGEDLIKKFCSATLVISSDNKFYILVDGAFYSLKINN